jgi:hypothetical protein
MPRSKKDIMTVVVTLAIEMDEENIQAYCGTYGQDPKERGKLRNDFKERAFLWVHDSFNGTGEFSAEVTLRHRRADGRKAL